MLSSVHGKRGGSKPRSAGAAHPQGKPPAKRVDYKYGAYAAFSLAGDLQEKSTFLGEGIFLLKNVYFLKNLEIFSEALVCLPT